MAGQKEKEKTISAVVDGRLCAGCGVCSALCPEEAIEMRLDPQRGVLEPHIIKSRCTGCGLCYRVCPGHSVDFAALNESIFGCQPENIYIGNQKGAYLGFSSDEKLRHDSASGGLVTQLLLYALQKKFIHGALVAVRDRHNPLRAKTVIARQRQDILESAGSQYCPVAIDEGLRQIVNAQKGEKFAIVGLPCHVHGVRKAAQASSELKDRIVFFLGLMCGHTLTFAGTTYFLNTKNGINEGEVSHISYRGGGWPGKTKVILKDGRAKEWRYPEFWKSGSGDCFIPERCLLCGDFTCEFSDISFADPWNLADDSKGTSFLIVRSAAGQRLLDGCVSEKKIELEKIEPARILRSHRNNIIRKKDWLQSSMRVFRILYGKEPPEYRFSFRPAGANFSQTVKALGAYFRARISLRPRLWPFISLYIKAQQYLRNESRKIQRRLWHRKKRT
jgi:coenzyme F420 hydrogenase subunit beta